MPALYSPKYDQRLGPSPCCLEQAYDDNRSMPLRGNSLGKLGVPGGHARVLVQGVPISRCWQRNGQRLLPYSGVHGDGPDQRLSKCRGQWQPNAPAILSVVRDAAFQRGRGASSSDLRPRRHFRRSESSQSCDDYLDVVCAPLGLHQRRASASVAATTASGVMRMRRWQTPAMTASEQLGR